MESWIRETYKMSQVSVKEEKKDERSGPPIRNIRWWWLGERYSHHIKIPKNMFNHTLANFHFHATGKYKMLNTKHY